MNDELLTPIEAVRRVIRPGSSIWAGGWTSVPTTLCGAIAECASEFSGATITTFLTPFDWDKGEILEHLRIVTNYAGPFERRAVNEGRFDYVPVTRWSTNEPPPGMLGPYDVGLIPISSPDEEGWCSFAGGIWFSKSVGSACRTLIGEVHPKAIRTGGENKIHISAFEAVALAAESPAPPVPPRSQETEDAANVICTLVASEILRDRATVQMGVGDVSAAMPLFLENLHDLGVHSEIIPGGMVDLLERGNVTGKYKALDPGKIVGTAFVLLPDAELERIDGNDAFELYDFTYTDDLKNLLQFSNFYAINNALAVDLTGNVSSETRGAQVYSGPGGQPVFAIAAATTSNGSVIVLPSSQLLESGERVSRILPVLEPGSTVTVHRGFVDFVVTEQGLARLTGKSLRQRIGELLAISHPDLRGELRQQASRVYGVTV